ncbi:MAG: hypothetical protein ACRC9P_08455, partial [Bacteroides sp.]
KMVQFEPTSLLANNQVFFLQEEEEYRFIQSDIFYGASRIPLYDSNQEGYKDEIIVRRKFASMHISVRGVDPNHKPEDYEVVLSGGFYRAFTFAGKPCAPTVNKNKYRSVMEWRSEFNDLLVMPEAIKVAPLEHLKPFEVKLLYQGQLVRQFTHDHIGHPIAPQAGERMNILIDLNKETGTGGTDAQPSDLSICVRVNDWHKVELWEEW